jgi:hypothetical protein
LNSSALLERGRKNFLHGSRSLLHAPRVSTDARVIRTPRILFLHEKNHSFSAVRTAVVVPMGIHIEAVIPASRWHFHNSCGLSCSRWLRRRAAVGK